MRYRRPNQPPALGSITVLALTLSALFGSWVGCASGGSTSTNSVSGTSSGSTEASMTTGTHAGSSGTAAGGSGGAGTGTGGAGGMPGCQGGEKTCAGMCVKVEDPAYGCGTTSCGACAAPPNAAATCDQGVCVLGTCATGFKNCDGNNANGCETDVTSDTMQCGACGSTCMVPNAVPTCVAGVCGIASCNPGWFDCDMDPKNGCEADLPNDPNNCNVCGNVCPVNETCAMGMCGVHCPKGKADCNNDNTDGCETPLFTNGNCNFCGDTCNLANSNSMCVNMAGVGVCNLGTCNPGFQNCNMIASTGCETNTTNDAANCASCGNMCPSGPNSTAVCVNSGCAINCDPGYSNCDNNPTTGCEIHTDQDPANCGTCGHVCPTLNDTPTCAGGMCLVQQCNAGFKDCNGLPTDGCEINTNNDPNNCGGCSNVSNHVCVIANGTAGCANGMCTVGTCNPGWADCDGNPVNGCETHVGVDTNNCGVCGKVCNVANATASCTGGTCTVAACNPGYTDCNNQPGDGCEANTSSDPNNCGGCNHQCFVANGTAGCATGSCTVASCNTGWANCNGLEGDGCEVNTTTSLGNCGACNNNCATTCAAGVLATSCINSACGIQACAAGHFDVDGICSTGCECASAGSSTQCAMPTSIGSLQVGQGTVFTGNLVPLGDEAYLTVTFNGNANLNYHPHITLTAGVGEFVFDVLSNCTGTLISCGVEGGSSNATVEWEEHYTAGDPNNLGALLPIPAVGTNGMAIIHVYRKPGLPVTCNPYTLTIGN